jgi:para-nitrobenzyl esterase
MKKLCLSLLLWGGLLSATFAQQITGENVAVTSTDAGKVRGYINNGIFTYKGIPYAEAKRFEMP